MTAITTNQSETQLVISQLIQQYQALDGALMPLLHAIQGQLGYIPDLATELIAAALKLSAAEIHGVISFYHQFKTKPQGQHRVQICRAEACQANGSRQLEQYAQELLGIDYDQTTEDQQISLAAVYCLGNCACGPSVRIDDKIHAEVGPERFQQLMSELKAEAKS